MTEEKYKISIILPVYNVEPYLERAMDSILNQTIGFESLQVIFANDCSSDGSGGIIDGYASKYKNVSALHLKENSGAAGLPRNIAMEKATAGYIMFLDPDDTLYPGACEAMHSTIEKTGADLAGGYYSMTGENGKLIHEKAPAYEPLQEGLHKIPQMLETAIKLMSFSTKIYKRSVIEKNNVSFPPGIPGQDTVFYCNYLLVSENMAYTNEPVFDYKIRSTSISNSLTSKFFLNISSCYRICEELFRKYEKEKYFRFVIDKALEYYFTRLLDSDLSKDELDKIFEEWKWICDCYCKHNITVLSEYSNTLFCFLKNGRNEDVFEVYNSLKSIRKYTQDLTEAKEYLSGQVDNLEKALSDVKDARDYFNRIYHEAYEIPIHKWLLRKIRKTYKH